jgi:hypothetical protein
MTKALQYNLAPKVIHSVNMCHLYLQVLSMSNITTAGGHCILPVAIKGGITKLHKSILHWPHQEHPPPSAWALWRIFLQYFSRNGRLHQPLGQWIAPTHQTWQWYKKTLSPVVYYASVNSILKYVPVDNSGITVASRSMYNDGVITNELIDLHALLLCTTHSTVANNFRIKSSMKPIPTSCSSQHSSLWSSTSRHPRILPEKYWSFTPFK